MLSITLLSCLILKGGARYLSHTSSWLWQRLERVLASSMKCTSLDCSRSKNILKPCTRLAFNPILSQTVSPKIADS